MLLNCGVGEDSWESLGLQGDQSWVFTGRTDIEAESPILWSPDVKSWLIWKDPDAGKDWRQEEKGTTEDKIVGWHHQLSGHGFGWTPQVGDRQGDLACCGSWGRRVRHDWATELIAWPYSTCLFSFCRDGEQCFRNDSKWIAYPKCDHNPVKNQPRGRNQQNVKWWLF